MNSKSILLPSISIILWSMSAFYAHASSKISGSLGINISQINFASTSDFSTVAAGLNGNFKYDFKNDSALRLKSDLEFETDEFAKDSTQKFLINPRSLYVDLKFKNLLIKLGSQTLINDGSDFLNPSDVIHSKNWIDPTAPQHLSSLGLSFSQEIQSWQWLFFWIPQQTLPILPGEHSPWWPREKRLPLASDTQEILIPSLIQYKFQNSVELNSSLKNNFVIRMQKKSEALELQGLVYEGLAQDPFLLTNISSSLVSLSPKLIVRADSPIKLIPLYYRHQVVAGNILIPFDSWTMKLGVNWKKPLGIDDRLPGESASMSLAVEKNIETSQGMTTLIFEKDFQKKQNKEQISFLKSIFENAWSFGIRYPMSEDLQIIGGLVYDQIGGSSLVKISARYRVNDSWNCEVATQALQGPEETLLGLYDRYDSVTSKLTYHF